MMIQNSVTHDFQRELDAMMLASGFEDSQKGGVTLLLCLLKTLFATPQSKIDTLRADHLSCYGYHRPTSPHIDKLARRGVRFTQVVSCSPWTLPGVAGLLAAVSDAASA